MNIEGKEINIYIDSQAAIKALSKYYYYSENNIFFIISIKFVFELRGLLVALEAVLHTIFDLAQLVIPLRFITG